MGGNPPNEIIPTKSYTIFTLQKVETLMVKNCNESTRESLLECSFTKIAEEFMLAPAAIPTCIEFGLCKIPQVETLLEKNG